VLCGACVHNYVRIYVCMRAHSRSAIEIAAAIAVVTAFSVVVVAAAAAMHGWMRSCLDQCDSTSVPLLAVLLVLLVAVDGVEVDVDIDIDVAVDADADR